MSTPLLDRELLFVTGKGGVGKTTIAAALGLFAARQGKRTLVCEVDAKGTLAAAYECSALAFKAREIQSDLWAMAMNTEDSLKEYLALQLRVPLLSRLGPLARTLDFVANAAPGVKEILTVGKVAYEVRERHYDLVVVDAAATGHIVGQLASPKAINDLVHVGMVHDQTQWMLDILHDPARTGVLIVTTPEEMPVTETIELAGRLDDETGVHLASVVVNRVLPELFGRGEEEVFEGLRQPDAEALLEERAGRGVVAVLDAAHLAVQLRRTRARHLDDLTAALPPATPVLYVPELFTRAMGMRLMSRVCDALSEELS
jgi:anion-transporting  ArsA/GET3 family ATPase